jgi:hypothetical protein
MSWARRLKRVFGIEINNTCARCGGTLRIIASIEEPAVKRGFETMGSGQSGKVILAWGTLN